MPASHSKFGHVETKGHEALAFLRCMQAEKSAEFLNFFLHTLQKLL